MQDVIELVEKKKLNTERNVMLLKWGLGIGAVALFSSVIIAVAQAVLAVALIGGVALVTVNLLPVFMMKLKNKRLQMIMAEAARNPIYTALTVYRQREEALVSYRIRIEEMIGEGRVYEDTVQKHVREFPDDHDCASMLADVEKFKQLIELKKLKFKEAKGTQAELDRTIRKMQSRWNAAQSAMKAKKAEGDSSDEFEELKLSVSFESVMRTSATAFAELDMALLDEAKPGKLQSLPAPAPEASAAVLSFPVTEKVAR